MSEPTYLIPFTDTELCAIYDAIERLERRDPDTEKALESVIDKITPDKVGDPRPAGAVIAGAVR